VKDVLSHLYVLLPVLDDDKHYRLGDDEVEKLLAKGEGWLDRHPQRDEIAQRYLKHRRHLVRAALDRLAPEEGDARADEAQQAAGEEAVEQPLRLNDARLKAVATALREAGANSVLDLGCGEGLRGPRR
jgi:hypothetical protein